MNDTIAQSIARQIRHMRKANQWTQAELAQHVGTSQRAIVRIEKGETSPNVTTLIKIAHAFGVPLNISFGETPPPNQVAATIEPSVEYVSVENLSGSIEGVKNALKDNLTTLLKNSF